MKISKGRLKQIIKEEVQNFKESGGNAYHDIEPEPARSEPSSQLPQELVQSWTQKIHKFIASQWSADSDFSSVRAEKPSIIAALKQAAKEMWNDQEPEPYHENTRPSAHRSSGQEEQLYRQIEANIKSAIHLGIGIEDILQRITTYIDAKGYKDQRFDQ